MKIREQWYIRLNGISKCLRRSLGVIGLFLFVSFNTQCQITTQSVISDGSEITKREIGVVKILKYDPNSLSGDVAQPDSMRSSNKSSLLKPTLVEPTFGFTLTDLAQVFPEVIVNDEKGTASIDYSKLIPIMFKLIQDQNTRIKGLEEKVASLMKTN